MRFRMEVIPCIVATLLVIGVAGCGNSTAQHELPTEVQHTRGVDFPLTLKVIPQRERRRVREPDDERGLKTLYTGSLDPDAIEATVRQLYEHLKFTIENTATAGPARRIEFELFTSQLEYDVRRPFVTCDTSYVPVLPDWPPSGLIIRKRDAATRPSRELERLYREYLDLVEDVNRVPRFVGPVSADTPLSHIRQGLEEWRAARDRRVEMFMETHRLTRYDFEALPVRFMLWWDGIPPTFEAIQKVLQNRPDPVMPPSHDQQPADRCGG